MMRKMVQSIGLLQNHFLKLLTDREAFETENTRSRVAEGE